MCTWRLETRCSTPSCLSKAPVGSAQGVSVLVGQGVKVSASGVTTGAEDVREADGAPDGSEVVTAGAVSDAGAGEPVSVGEGVAVVTRLDKNQ